MNGGIALPVYKPTWRNICQAAEALKRGKLVAFPTETVYGLGGLATDVRAIRAIFEAKNRPRFDPLIVHFSDLDMIREYEIQLGENELQLARHFWPGPLTLIVQRSKRIPSLVTSGLDTMAIRIPRHRVALQLIKKLGHPVAAPSANPFGYLSPVTAQHVDEQLGRKVEMILDGGACRVGVESTIIDVSGHQPKYLRPGGISVKEIERVLGKGLARDSSSKAPHAPGQLKSHYAPKKKLILLGRNRILARYERAAREGENVAFLFFTAPPVQYKRSSIPMRILSERGDDKEAARRLFNYLHLLDQSEARIILAEKPFSSGLGLAVLDRLTRASKGRNKR
jgi:L-threonylcarbamoyladenylate synthase